MLNLPMSFVRYTLRQPLFSSEVFVLLFSQLLGHLRISAVVRQDDHISMRPRLSRGRGRGWLALAFDIPNNIKQDLGIARNSVSSRSVFARRCSPRSRDNRGMDHVSLDAARLKPARQPEAVAAGFEGNRNPRDRAAGPDRLILPAMQQGQQPFWVRLELLARLTLNPGKHAGDEPARLAHLDDGYDRAILVQGDEGPAQVVRLRHRGTPSLNAATKL